MAGGQQPAVKKQRPVLREPEVAKDAQLLVFDASSHGIRPRSAGSSSKRPSRASEAAGDVPDPKDLADADDIADMEVSQIWERLKDTVDDLHASTLRGKERKKYMLDKVVRLGGEAPKGQHHATNIRIGMNLKSKEREAKRKAEAREMDLVLARSTSGRVDKTRSSRSKGGRRRR